MKTMVMLGLVALLATPSAASAQDVSGTWDLEMTWDGSVTSTGVCTFTQNGEALAGSCGGDDAFPITGRVENNRVSWRVEVTQGDAAGRMELSGELDPQGTTIAGSCSVEDGPRGTFTMTRRR